MNSCSCTYNKFIVPCWHLFTDHRFGLKTAERAIENKTIFNALKLAQSSPFSKREDVCAQTSTDSLPQDQVKGLHVFPQTLFYTTASALT